MTKKVTERKIGGFTVSNNIPLPGPINRQNGAWPFHSMEVGESFPLEDARQALTCRSTVSQYGRRHPEFKFSIRKTGGAEEAPYRCWRVK